MAKDNSWTTPQAMAIPKRGIFHTPAGKKWPDLSENPGLLRIYGCRKGQARTGASHARLRQKHLEISNRLTRIFLRDESGRRPVYGGTQKFQTDPHWKDYLLFYEYFHGDNGAGLGASHQTGWTGLVAKLIEIFGKIDAAQLLAAGKKGAFEKEKRTADRDVERIPISHRG